MKALLKRLAKALPIPLSKNHLYDIQTRKIIHRVCRPNSNAIDIGCHKGEILDQMRKAAPKGRHFGFEPIPDLHAYLVEKYRDTNCTISPIALSNTSGTSTFNYVVSNPSYSGLRKRDYDRPHEEDTQIIVQTDRLDNCIPSDLPVHLIKIDVEGGELQVLEGAVQTLQRWRPVIIFEHGLGASEHYGAGPDALFDQLLQVGLSVNTLGGFLNGREPMSRQAFRTQYVGRKNYYFVGYSR